MNLQDLPQPTASFLTAAAEFTAGKSRSADIIRTAAEFLGADVPAPDSLVALAALSDDDIRRDEIAPLVDDAVRDLGLTRLTPETVAEVLVRDAARKTAAGVLRPYEGASTIWYTGRHLDNGTAKLANFMQLMDAWENNLPDRPAIEEEIRQAARTIDTTLSTTTT
jgi:hypothetical protein